MATKYKYTEHPAIVVIRNKPFLRVFEDPFIEESLPKWKLAVKKDKSNHDQNTVNNYIDVPDLDDQLGTVNGDEVRAERSVRVTSTADVALSKKSADDIVRNAKWDRDRYIRNLRNHMSALAKVKHSVWWRIKDKLSISKGEDVEIAFDKIKENFISPTTDGLLKAQKLVDTIASNMEVAGQYVKAEQLRDSADIVKYQIALSKVGYTKYLSEDQVIDFLLKAERGVMVDYLRYYNEILPVSVVEKKKEADKLLVFDNYVIIYYDSGVDLFRRHEEQLDDDERRKRRDPILCGVIRGCRKLFYICDWVYKDDDLTLDVVEKTIGNAGVLPKFDDPEMRDRQNKLSDEIAMDIDSMNAAVDRLLQV